MYRTRGMKIYFWKRVITFFVCASYVVCYDEVMSKICTSFLAAFFHALMCGCVNRMGFLFSVFFFGLMVMGEFENFFSTEYLIHDDDDGGKIRAALAKENTRQISRLTLESNIRFVNDSFAIHRMSDVVGNKSEKKLSPSLSGKKADLCQQL